MNCLDKNQQMHGIEQKIIKTNLTCHTVNNNKENFVNLENRLYLLISVHNKKY